MFSKKKNIVETYTGSQASAQKQFLRDAEKKAKKGYFPVSERWEQGSYGLLHFLFALLLCLIIIGILIFIYMLIVKPPGTLTVTYELREAVLPTTADEKLCPRCAETVKIVVKVCRYCGHEFGSAGK